MTILVALMVLTGCKKDSSADSIDITGSWELMDITTKAASIGGETIEVLIDFNSDNTFKLRQKLGEGRFKEYEGNWTLSGVKLSGKYSDGKSWGTTYDISLEGTTLTMIPDVEGTTESYIYRKKN